MTEKVASQGNDAVNPLSPSPATRDKISKALRGHRKSAETRRKMSESRKAYVARIKGG